MWAKLIGQEFETVIKEYNNKVNISNTLSFENLKRLLLTQTWEMSLTWQLLNKKTLIDIN